jgi:serine/threonine protein kinase
LGELKRLPEREPRPAHRYREGDVIADKYQLVRVMGTGGMGAVWIAHNLALDVNVAVKLIRAGVATASAAGRRLQEARAAARLGHPAIVRVFDFGRTTYDEPFIVMELLEGESLGEALGRRRRISAVRAVQTLLPIADALSVAHTKGIVHRDLKPENVFLHRADTGRTEPKIVDFGIATLDRGQDRRITQDGTIVGSPAYMSPEQARGEGSIDNRTDVWSFAVVLYELMTGEAPFKGDNHMAVLKQVIEHDPVPVMELGAGDDALWAIIERALQKDPSERWQSMRALGAALALWLTGQGIEEDVSGASLAATWLNNDGRKDVFSSQPPPSGRLSDPGAVDPLAVPGLRLSAPRIAVPVPDSDHVAVVAPRSRPRRKAARFFAVICVVALMGGGFILTRQLLSPKTKSVLSLLETSRVAALAPVPAHAPAPAPSLAPPPSKSAKSEPAEVQPSAAPTHESTKQAAPSPHPPTSSPPRSPTRRTRSTAKKSEAVAAPSDLKLPY